MRAKTCLLHPWKQWARNSYQPIPRFVCNIEALIPWAFALGICTSILHTNLGSWLITITYMSEILTLLLICTCACTSNIIIFYYMYH